ncbi:two component transcriptional regulator, LytTR family [Chitinophaga sp. YR573]|uniref:LytR/AlgR family response regulator transcription factor n=1 Tax=Chitinophaga sp. YR573 TaxID=1881040 RepID=UPI0008C9E147|nr:LytTR family DNA-binding domain-containing protein [Chitinophaga sp. YR573]SEW28753.1 two component transcriptional regulator, LytTR family [Chitinophaga sp. YR573]
MKIRSIIIDDEDKSRDNLRVLLTEYCPSIEIVAEADSAITALKLIKQLEPALLFLDIEMPGGSGFELLQSLPANRNFEVIFVTAYDNYGIAAVKACAIDYILKPIDVMELSAAVDKAIAQIGPDNQRLKELVANMNKPVTENRIAFPLSDKIVFALPEDIIRMEAAGNYTHVYLSGQKKLIVCKTLKEYNDLLINRDFIRTHQSHLINRHKITAWIKTEGGAVAMEDGSQIPVSRQRRDEVLKLLMK